MVRTAGLPFDDLQGFQTARTLAAARNCDTLLAQLLHERRSLCDRIHGLIAGEGDAAYRRALLTAKRRIYNLKTVTEGTIGLIDATAANFRLPADLRHWNRSVGVYASNRIEGQQAIKHDLEDIRAHLSRLWDTTDISRGVLFAQPKLYHSAEQAIAKSLDLDRKVEAAIIAYFFRAATKTSPFSTFTSVTIGRLIDHAQRGGSPIAPESAPASLRSRVFFNAAFVRKVANLLTVTPNCREHLPLMVGEASYSDGGFIHFLAHSMGVAGSNGADEGEILRTLKETPPVRLAIDLLHVPRVPRMTARDLCLELARQTGAAPARARVLVDGLLDCGLLVPRLDFSANDFRAVDRLATHLGSLPSVAHREAGDNLAQIQPLVDQAGESSVDRSAQLIGAVGAAASATLAALNAAAPEGLDPILMRHNVVRKATVDLDLATFDSFKPALSRLASILPLFDAEAPIRTRVYHAFARRFGVQGECTNILELFEAFCGEAPPHNGLSGEELFAGRRKDGDEEQSVAKLRTTLMRAMRAQCYGQSLAELPSSFWAEFQRPSLLPLGLPLCVTFAGQLGPNDRDNGQQQFVLNKVLPGSGMPVAHYAAEGEAPAQQWLYQTLGTWLPSLVGDAEPVDLIGTFAFDGLIRPRLFPSALAYPGEPIEPHARGLIDWSDLSAKIDAQGGSKVVLTRKSTGRRISPIHLGTLGTLHLPPFYRFLKCFGPAFAPDWSVIDYFEALADSDAKEVRHYGRVVDEGVVISRETWCVPSEMVPRYGAGENEFEFYLRLRRWAGDMGFPRHVYVTPMRTHDYLKSDLPAQSFRRAHKPFFVDWDGLISHRLFRRFASHDQGALTITEAHPTYLQTPRTAGESSYAVEHMIELNAR
nr:lantibiotic dehydratase [Sphingomonas chungangi]